MNNKRLIIWVLSLLIFVGCAAYIGHYFISVNEDAAEMSQIQDIVRTEEKKSAGEQPNENQEEEPITYA